MQRLAPPDFRLGARQCTNALTLERNMSTNYNVPDLVRALRIARYHTELNATAREALARSEEERGMHGNAHEQRKLAQHALDALPLIDRALLDAA